MRTNKPKISIIIPVYGVELYIEDCIRSVMVQDYTGQLECILVDDCSPDKSIEIAEQVISAYRGCINFRIIHHEKNKGLSGARNTGISNATGEYVYLLDSDDEIVVNCISALVEPLMDHSFDMVIGDYRAIGTDKEFQKLNMVTGETYFGNSIPASYYHGKWMQIAVNKLYSIDYLTRENLVFKEGLIHEDELWSLEIAASAKNICGVKKETYIYKIREDSITTAITQGKADRKLKALMTIHKEYHDFAASRNILVHPDYFMLYEKAASLPLVWAEKMCKEKVKKTLSELRDLSHISFLDFIRMHKLNIKKYILYAHIALPGFLAWWWYTLVTKTFVGAHSAIKSFCVSRKQSEI